MSKKNILSNFTLQCNTIPNICKNFNSSEAWIEKKTYCTTFILNIQMSHFSTETSWKNILPLTLHVAIVVELLHRWPKCSNTPIPK